MYIYVTDKASKPIHIKNKHKIAKHTSLLKNKKLRIEKTFFSRNVNWELIKIVV